MPFPTNQAISVIQSHLQPYIL